MDIITLEKLTILSHFSHPHPKDVTNAQDALIIRSTEIMKYALWIVFGLIVIGSIQSERDKQQASESIAAFEAARQGLIKAKQNEEKARNHYHEMDKQLSILEALSQYEENEKQILSLQKKLNESALSLEIQKKETLESSNLLHWLETQGTNSNRTGTYISMIALMILLGALYRANTSTPNEA